MRILTVDDSRLMIPYFKHIFQDLENVIWVGHAYNVPEADELMRKERPEVLFLDICLKKGNGFTYLRSIKRRYPAVSVFMLSNNKNAFYTQKSRDQGALFLIDKTNEFHLIPYFLKALSLAINSGQRIEQFNPHTVR